MSPRLREEGWLPAHRARLESALADLARARGDGRRRVATFDWDNTMMRGDVGDLTLAHMLERDLVLQPRDRDWSRLAPLTEAARAALGGACDALAEPGAPLPTSRAPECAAVIAHVAWGGRTPAGDAAFTVPVGRFYKPTYAFMAQLLARHDEARVRAIARDAFGAASAAPVGRRALVGGVEVERFARLHRPMIELARALEEVGVEVWIVSASAQPIVEAIAESAGLRADRVIGVRLARGAGGVLESALEACGETGADGDEGPVMTWLEGKRCWINRVIFELPPSRQRARQEDPALRAVIAAGDSDGDVAMLEDATVIRVVLDRGQPALARAIAAGDPGSWLVQPLFVDPAAR